MPNPGWSFKVVSASEARKLQKENPPPTGRARRYPAVDEARCSPSCWLVEGHAGTCQVRPGRDA